MQLIKPRRGRPSESVKARALHEVLIRGNWLETTAARLELSEPLVRRWVREARQAGSVCAVFGCPRPVRGLLCDIHQLRQRWWQFNPRSLYSTAAWRNGRSWFLHGHPLWGTRIDGRRHAEHSWCAEHDAMVPATHVDHNLPHRGDWWQFWDVENWQALCHQCHSFKTYKHDGALM